MRVKKEYVVLAAIIMALSLYLFMRNPDRTHYQLPQLPAVDQKAISKIEISRADGAIVLKRKDDRWHIEPEEYLADDDNVNTMLDTIEGMTVTALVSQSKSYERYDLGDDKKITIRAWEGDNLARQFDIGKPASSFRHTFVKLADDDRVYHAPDNFRRKFDQTVDRLRDKSVLSFEKGDIQQIRLARGEEALILNRPQSPVEVDVGKDTEAAQSLPTEKATPAWQTADGKDADEAKIDQLLNTLSSLRCEKYMEETTKEDLSDPIYSLQLKGVEEYSLSIFDKKDKEANSHPAISSANAYPFMLGQWQVNNIMKKPDELLKTQAAPAPEK